MARFFLLFWAALCLGQNVGRVSRTMWTKAYDLTVAEDFAYCCLANGLLILPVSDPSNPTFLTQCYLGSGQGGIFAA